MGESLPQKLSCRGYTTAKVIMQPRRSFLVRDQRCYSLLQSTSKPRRKSIHIMTLKQHANPFHPSCVPCLGCTISPYEHMSNRAHDSNLSSNKHITGHAQITKKTHGSTDPVRMIEIRAAEPRRFRKHGANSSVFPRSSRQSKLGPPRCWESGPESSNFCKYMMEQHSSIKK